jgi:hypothetical protein
MKEKFIFSATGIGYKYWKNNNQRVAIVNLIKPPKNGPIHHIL